MAIVSTVSTSASIILPARRITTCEIRRLGFDVEKVQQVSGDGIQIDVVADDLKKAEGRQQHEHALGRFQHGHRSQAAMVVAVPGLYSDVVGAGHLGGRGALVLSSGAAC